jgi:5-methylcytosine-specific restriction endonuclease McrBC GTP-binding regulatory subunit McrB
MIKVVWVNKENFKLSKGLGDWKGFNANSTINTWEKFYNGYSDTMDFMENVFKKQNNKFPDMDTNKRVSGLVAEPTLNTILYGPPGTGKTYNTIAKAAEIITVESFADPNRYSEAKAIFKQHLGKRIEFVTFHQNYSYEDFVAGLRPDTKADSSNLQFKEHRGIFYKICERARLNWDQYKTGRTYTEPPFEEVLDAFLQPLLEDGEVPVEMISRGVKFFITENNNNVNLSFRKHSGGTGHKLSIATIKELYEGKRTYNSAGLGVYFSPLVQALKTKALGMRVQTGAVELENYVLIIDEINRANISRVFGELITLLEDDKRLGAENELKLRLPGLPDEELFGVPPNLYLVGTMNTADKSIALIDIALRRRFVFEDMYPREEVVNRLLPNPYNIYLLALNERIKALKGADFMIGHAYFIGKTGDVGEVIDVFNQKIIPLLNEYFYNQRNTSVHGLLNSTPLAGIVFDTDPFIGAKARKV